ncbi:hypothetical protein ACF08N_36985 [Streptomyces sp. NPDC015127]|uniref:hypothetical protein n=1 Tax=Streptomyces sp. NPDC015127 TaxID=3364939 RepID=UPI0036FBB1F5
MKRSYRLLASVGAAAAVVTLSLTPAHAEATSTGVKKSCGTGIKMGQPVTICTYEYMSDIQVYSQVSATDAANKMNADLYSGASIPGGVGGTAPEGQENSTCSFRLVTSGYTASSHDDATNTWYLAGYGKYSVTCSG